MKRSKFNLSHTQLHTGRMGRLIPIGLMEVLPGDTVQHASQVLIRAAPLATPPMHPVRIDVRHFFVPNRLVWEDWEDFITGGPDGMDASSFPIMDGPFNRDGSLDHLGVRPQTTRAVSALPMRGLTLIWNEYYRDQDLQQPLPWSDASGSDTTTLDRELFVNWEKDYFTTARPFEQKGPDITLPLGTSAPVSVSATQVMMAGIARNLVSGASDESGKGSVDYTGTNVSGSPLTINSVGTADLSSATAATVNELRLAMALQRYQEARARFGSRYTEYLRYLGVRSSDARLQRPEYLGGGRSPLQFSEVMSTAVSSNALGDDTTLPGNFGGHGIGANRSNRYRRFIEEHGFIFSLLSVIPQTMYPDALARHWNRRTKEDFFQKELQHIGQQQVLNKEVTLAHDNPNGVFGYQDRYDEYRRTESGVHGEFRPDGYLADWHFARNLPSNVALNEAFVKANPTTSPFQLQDIAPGTNNAVTLYIAARHQVVARRLLARKGSSFIL